MNIGNIDLKMLQTSRMKIDETTIAMCDSISEQLNLINPNIANIISNIDTLSEDVLDEIATSKNIFWYDAKAAINVKRSIIKNADKVFKTLGTNYAVEQVAKDYFGDGEVEEWYTYNGEPYHFKVSTTNPSVTGEVADKFKDTIQKVKRLSTRLDEVVVRLDAELDINYGFALQTGTFTTIVQGA